MTGGTIAQRKGGHRHSDRRNNLNAHVVTVGQMRIDSGPTAQ
jgi:hypothetical protein